MTIFRLHDMSGKLLKAAASYGSLQNTLRNLETREFLITRNGRGFVHYYIDESGCEVHEQVVNY